MKKIVVTLTALLFVILSLGVSVSATYTISPYADTIRYYEEVYDAIYEAIYAQKSYLDISKWQIRDYDIMDIFTDVIHNSPEFFYADPKLSYRYNKDGKVTSLSFSYNMSITKRTECMKQYQEEISYIVNEVAQHQFTEPEMALYVHDYLISSYSYDTSETIFDVYSFLMERKGVCHAYSLCYMAVMRELGISCFMVVSEEMNHSWNLIQIDGQWYHVDLVFDDPQPDRPGQVQHKHFLLSDEAIAQDQGQGVHYGWVSNIACSDKTYDQSYWRVSNSRMIYLNDTWYFINSSVNTIYRMYFDGHGMRILHIFKERWHVEPGNSSSSYWKGLFAGFAEYSGYLYFNTPYAILRLHSVTGETEELIGVEEENLNIYGINVFKGQMEYLVGDSPDGLTTSYMEQFPMRYLKTDESIENVFLPFTDVSRVSPYYTAVEYLYESGMINGITETRFSPDGNMTRAQFAALLSRLYGYNPVSYQGTVLYTDVDKNSWYAPYVMWVTESGYMNGMGGGIFAPEETVTREQMYTIIASVARSLKLGSTETKPLETMDRWTIADWARNGVDYCYTNGLIGEKYQYVLTPNAYVKRSEIADVLYRLCRMREAV